MWLIPEDAEKPADRRKNDAFALQEVYCEQNEEKTRCRGV